MLKLKVADNEYSFELNGEHAMLNGKPVDADVVRLDKNRLHVIIDGRSMTIELLDKDESGKNINLLVNNQKIAVGISDRYDALLKQLGMDKVNGSISRIIKAPMPGLVLRIDAKEGVVVKKGETLLVLEAMKMENAIKAAADGKVKKINVSLKAAVEKNTVLIEME